MEAPVKYENMEDELLDALENIASAAQSASNCNPEQFCEYAYNIAIDAIQKYKRNA